MGDLPADRRCAGGSIRGPGRELLFGADPASVVRVSGDRSPAVRYLEVERATLYVEDHGVGAPVVLIHGGLSSSATWAPALAYLVNDFRVITPDTRGHGRSTNESGTLSYAQIADDVAVLIAAIGLVRPVVGGYSDDGQVALEFGARHPETASALMVGAAYPDFVDSGLQKVFRAFLGADEAGRPDLAHLDVVLGDVAELVKSRHPGGERQWQALAQQTAPMWLDYPGLTNDVIRSIKAPVVLFTGDRDDLLPLDLTLELYRLLENAELAVCPNADHFGTMRPERARLLAAILGDFASRHSSTR
jgi:pimeloyl-ACP methyl ester carboxylesterase